jgi:hypothetical protein
MSEGTPVGGRRTVRLVGAEPVPPQDSEVTRGDPLGNVAQLELSPSAQRLMPTETSWVKTTVGIREGAARLIARVLLAEADRLVESQDRLRGRSLEVAVEPLRDALTGFVNHTITALTPFGVADSDARRSGAAYWISAAGELGRPPDGAALVVALTRRYELGSVDPRWDTALSRLTTASRQSAAETLGRTIAAELADRVPASVQSALLRVARETATRLADRGRASWPSTAQRLRDDTCHETWQLLVLRYADAIPMAELERLLGRRLVDRFGKPREEQILELRSELLIYAQILDLRDDALLAALLRAIWSADASVIELDDARTVADGREHDAWAELDEHVSAVLVEVRAALQDAVEQVMAEMATGIRTQRRAAELLLHIAEHGGYDDAAAIATAWGEGERPVDPEAAVRTLMTRAYDRLRAGLLEHGFVMLEDADRDADADAVADLLDCSSLVLANGVARPSGAALSDNASVAEAMGLELANATLEAVILVLRADTTSDAAFDELLRALKRARRNLRDGDAAPSDRGRCHRGYEPPIFPETDLPAPSILPSTCRLRADAKAVAAGSPALRAGRVVVLPVNALPIERRHDERRFRDIIPALPKPLIKVHSGRWWAVPDGGVGLPTKSQ